MSPATIFQTHLVLGYVPWLLGFGAYVWPRLCWVDHYVRATLLCPWCQLGDDYRHFRADRITEARVLNEGFCPRSRSA